MKSVGVRKSFCNIGFGCELFFLDKNVTKYATISLNGFEGDLINFCFYTLINLVLNTIFSFSSHLNLAIGTFFTRFSFFLALVSRIMNLIFSHINFLATLSLLAFKFNLNLIMAILITVLSNFRTG